LTIEVDKLSIPVIGPAEEANVTTVLKCDDLNPGCTFEARGNTDEDVLKKAAEHAKTAHKMAEIPPDVLDKARSAIRDEGKAHGQKAGS
jgi:predicted small metal-binding protein